MKKEQFNVRIAGDLKSAAATVAARLGWSHEAFAEAAFRNFLGTEDRIEAEKRKLARRTAKELSLSFNSPGQMFTGAELAHAA